MKNALFGVITTILIFTACQDSAKLTGEEKDTTHYKVIFRESEAGEYTKWDTGSNSYRFYYTYTDRGRGPEYNEEITLNDQNYIVDQHISGVNYLKDSIVEEFSVVGNTASFNNPSGNGESSFTGNQLYFRYDGSPAIYEILANLLLDSNQQSVKLYPDGEIALVQNFSITLEEGFQASLLMINGLGMNPVYVWMDDSKEMIAFISGNRHVVREDLLSERLTMKSKQDSLENVYLKEAAETLTHEYSSALIKGVNVFTAQGKMLKNQDVYIEGKSISSIVPSGRQSNTSPELVLDGTGKTLMPGLFDMHTHNTKFRGALHIAGGVTSVRDLANNKKLVDLRAQFDENKIIGPRIVYLCGIIDGPGPFANQRNVINNLEEGLTEIEAYKDLGYHQIKLYSSIKPEWVAPLAEKSHELGMKVSGHIPAFMNASQAIDQGFDEIQHINMLFLNFLSDTIDTRTPLRFTMVAAHGAELDLTSDTYLDFVNKLKSQSIIVDPTVSIFENMFVAQKGVPSPTYNMVMDRLPLMNQRAFISGGLPKPEGMAEKYAAAHERMLEVVFDLYQRGITIVPGTDGLPGFLYHRELELYHKSGIPAAEVLKMATIKAAQITGVSQSLGSVEAGKLADLILIDGDPLENMSDIRRVEWIMKNGNLYYPEEIYASMGIKHFK